MRRGKAKGKEASAGDQGATKAGDLRSGGAVVLECRKSPQESLKMIKREEAKRFGALEVTGVDQGWAQRRGRVQVWH